MRSPRLSIHFQYLTEETKVLITSSLFICLEPMARVCFIAKTLHLTYINGKNPTL